jgi:hypothetical protein
MEVDPPLEGKIPDVRSALMALILLRDTGMVVFMRLPCPRWRCAGGATCLKTDVIPAKELVKKSQETSNVPRD